MGRGKRKRKAIQRKKRIAKMRKGKHVSFSLANSPRIMRGRTNKHEYKTNIHNLNFKNAKFKNVKYTSTNMTNCKFKNVSFVGVDFINTNLKKSKFRNARLENVIFYGANMKDVDFKDTKFKNVYFINTDLSNAKNINLDDSGIVILKGEPTITITETLKNSIDNIMTMPKIKKHYVLTTKVSKGKTINKWIINLLKNKFSDDDLIKGFNRIYTNDKINSNKTFFTYYSYLEFFCNYLKKDGIL